ncbi:Aste57867_8561 [Aphanomyces stellatus]|uniref:Aste57867_8561 protein n=1 Tax=Aphanomyces stellatus TaxID=120398 RepID=A0A485KKQ8_9STRA|nr:hypothetical protein As57867_008529 [Aphanomyces stellatus]VFT85447.1 Aste57867_8561 [Aphanomyces stellatus]
MSDAGDDDARELPPADDEASQKETIRAAFQNFDADGSGCIDASELADLVSTLGGILSPDELKAALAVLDTDGNGFVSLDEFERWWLSKSSDLDGDGQTGDLEKALERLKELGQERFHVDIHTACWKGDTAVVERLLEHDPEKPNARDTTEFGDMNTPLHYAAYQGHTALCKRLMAAKAKVDATNALGCTPIFFAAQQDRIDTVRCLLQEGRANVRLRESEHQFSPVDVAASTKMLDVFRGHHGEKPSVPAPVEVSVVTTSSFRIAWKAPPSKVTETLPISGYKLKLTPTNGGKATLKLMGPYPTALTLNKLSPDTAFDVQVSAVSLHGASDYSTAVTCATSSQELAPSHDLPQNYTS